MPKGIDYEIESSLNESYKRICEFEKYFYDKIIVENNGDLTLEIDKDLYSEIDNPNKVNDDFFQSTSYSSYKELFNNRYKSSFKNNLKYMNFNSIEREIGRDHLIKVFQDDKELKKLKEQHKKELDLDNDGIPDRIDIDDTRNSVQTVKDLSSVKNSTNASTQRYNEKKEQRKKERNKEQELEL